MNDTPKNESNMKSSMTMLVIMLGIIIALTGSEIWLKYSYKEKAAPVVNSDQPSYKLTYVTDDDCEECFDIELFAALISESQPGAAIVEESFDYQSKEGQNLIDKHDFKQIPALIIEGDLESNQQIYEVLTRAGDIDGDTFVIRKTRAPYRDLEENRLVGQFGLIYLDDPTCDECYDVGLHKNALENLQVKTKNERILDYQSDEGQRMISQYNITQVPTIIMQGELDVFENFSVLWEQVGTIESDGTYVYRDMRYMGKYRNLENGEVEGTEPVLQ